MIIHCLNGKIDISLYGDWAELYDSDLENIAADEIWYWYSTAWYEGSGHLIARVGDRYFHHDMSHCSCFGPLDHVDNSPEPLDELKAGWKNNPSYWKEVEPLFNAIEK